MIPYAWPDPDRAYANGAFIQGAEDYVPRWQSRAAAFRATLGPRAQLNLPYGSGERQRHDLFLPEGPPKGTVIFIHGGYWMAFTRSDWSHLAAGPLARGWAVAMPSYTLAPAARIADMTAEMAQATHRIAATCPGPLIVTGHSAGGHLAARLATLDLPLIRSLPISPLAELAPLLATAMNRTLGLTPAEVAAESPARQRPRPGRTAHVWVGADERPAFLWQARTLAEEWSCPCTFSPGTHHFNVIDALEDPASALTETLLAP